MNDPTTHETLTRRGLLKSGIAAAAASSIAPSLLASPKEFRTRHVVFVAFSGGVRTRETLGMPANVPNLVAMAEEGVTPDVLKRLWLHQANKTMNDFIGRKVMGRVPEPEEQPNILQDYANTSSAGSIIAFSKYSEDLEPGETGLICSFGAGYSVGSVLVERA